jgi:hypothetical protein
MKLLRFDKLRNVVAEARGSSGTQTKGTFKSSYSMIIKHYNQFPWACGRVVVEALGYQLKGRGFETR